MDEQDLAQLFVVPALLAALSAMPGSWLTAAHWQEAARPCPASDLFCAEHCTLSDVPDSRLTAACSRGTAKTMTSYLPLPALTAAQEATMSELKVKCLE